MADIIIKKLDETYIQLTASEPWMEYDISEKFCFEKIGAKYDPRVKRGVWDGKIRLYNRKSHILYLGLFFKLLEFLESKNLSYEIDGDMPININDISDDDLNELVKSINPHDNGKPITPYYYQIDALKYQISMGRTTSLAATSAGKSLIIYLATRIYQLTTDKKIFIIVPSAMLVEQMYDDFKNYSNFKDSHWNVSHHCQKISAKYNKGFSNQIIITTWQSLNKMPKCLMNEADVIFIDEVHNVKGTCLTDLMKASTHVPIRHGLTGTLDGVEYNELLTEGLLGPVKRIVTAKELIDNEMATKLEINIIVLNYPDSIKKEFHNQQKKVKPANRYNSELEFIYQNEYRNNTLQQFIKCNEGNSLILFDRVEEYGKKLYEDMLNQHEHTFLITGDIKTENRNEIKNNMESYEDALIYASFGTMSTGISIKKLNNLIYAGGGKSHIRFAQSIGRLMRLHKSKSLAYIYDFIDNLSYKGMENYFYLHGKERIDLYTSEGHKIIFNVIDL